MFSSVRVRLTLWYVLVFGVLLTGFSLSVYFVLSNEMYARLDRSLSKDAVTTATLFQAETEETGGDAVSGAAEALVELRQPDVYVALYDDERLLASGYPDGEQPVMSAELLSSAQAAGHAIFKIEKPSRDLFVGDPAITAFFSKNALLHGACLKLPPRFER